MAKTVIHKGELSFKLGAALADLLKKASSRGWKRQHSLIQGADSEKSELLYLLLTKENAIKILIPKMSF